MKTVIMNNRVNFFAVIVMILSMSSAGAQPAANQDMADMDHGGSTGGGTMQNESPQGEPQQVKSQQGGSAPADARDPHAYSDGYNFGEIQRPRFADEQSFASLLLDRLEGVSSNGNTSGIYDLQFWYGRDYDRVELKAEGEISDGKLEDASTELLWGHALSTYWNSQLGVRYDSGEAPDRTWLVFGIQGLAPYWFEIDATGYVGEQGRTALNLEAVYQWLFTQKLILQSRFEVDLYGKQDIERGLGKGLSDLGIGFRLRYEFWREFAPYLGVEWTHKFGETADLARLASQDVRETRLIAGLRFWF